MPHNSTITIGEQERKATNSERGTCTFPYAMSARCSLVLHKAHDIIKQLCFRNLLQQSWHRKKYMPKNQINTRGPIRRDRCTASRNWERYFHMSKNKQQPPLRKSKGPCSLHQLLCYKHMQQQKSTKDHIMHRNNWHSLSNQELKNKQKEISKRK
jgi:hypothetical protein